MADIKKYHQCELSETAENSVTICKVHSRITDEELIWYRFSRVVVEWFNKLGFSNVELNTQQNLIEHKTVVLKLKVSSVHFGLLD